MAEPSFWDRLGPGLLQTGMGVYGGRQANKADEERLRRAQGPLYDQLMSQAGTSLSAAGSMDPKALGAERFATQQGLLAPGMEAQRAQLMRELQARGQLGTATFQPVPGTVATPGVPMNPQLAALYAAQEGAKAKSAYESLGEGERYLDTLLNRSKSLQGAAQTARSTGAQVTPYKKTTGGMIAGGLTSLLKDPRAASAVWQGAKKIPGMLGEGWDWMTGAQAAPVPYMPNNISMPNFSFDDWF